MRQQSKSKRRQSAMPGEQALPRIIIEKEEPWLRVQENVNRALAEALEARLAALPGGAQGEQAKKLRPALEQHLASVRQRMWEMTKPNLRVNGFNYEDFVETTEPFDESLDRQIWALNTERVNWETKVVEKRRIKAGEVANLIDDLELRRDAAIWKPSEEDERQELEAQEAVENVSSADIAKPERHAEVLETFSKVVSDLSDLASNAPQQLSRAERAQVVREELSRLP